MRLHTATLTRFLWLDRRDYSFDKRQCAAVGWERGPRRIENDDYAEFNRQIFLPFLPTMIYIKLLLLLRRHKWKRDSRQIFQQSRCCGLGGPESDSTGPRVAKRNWSPVYYVHTITRYDGQQHNQLNKSATVIYYIGHTLLFIVSLLSFSLSNFVFFRSKTAAVDSILKNQFEDRFLLVLGGNRSSSKSNPFTRDYFERL